MTNCIYCVLNFPGPSALPDLFACIIYVRFFLEIFTTSGVEIIISVQDVVIY